MQNIKSKFSKDYSEEQRLGVFLDPIYQELYDDKFIIERLSDKDSQDKGIDVMFTSLNNKIISKIDEKAQLDYIGKTLPTCAFEILSGNNTEGWLFDDKKETNLYFLINSIQVNKDNEFTRCIIYSIKRDKLIELLNTKGINKNKAYDYAQCIANSKCKFKKLFIKELNDYTEGYFTYSIHKRESPINLILKLEFLLDNSVASIIHS